jgi:hypothetical protein
MRVINWAEAGVPRTEVAAILGRDRSSEREFEKYADCDLEKHGKSSILEVLY